MLQTQKANFRGLFGNFEGRNNVLKYFISKLAWLEMLKNQNIKKHNEIFINVWPQNWKKGE